MSKELESYLVRLGFDVDAVSKAKFTGEIEAVGKKVSSVVGSPTKGLIGDLLKLQFAFTGVFASLGAAFVGFVDKMGATNQEMRLGAMHALISQEAYTKMNVALKALGVTLDDLWDPKTRKEFEQLWSDQGKMYAGAHQFSDQMEDIRFQFIRFQQEVEGFGATVLNKVFAELGLGSGQLSDQLAKLNDWFLVNMPKWSDEVSNDLVPALQTTWDVLKDVGEVAKDALAIFQNIVGILSGDSTLEGTAVTFDSVAKSVQHTVEWVDDLVKSFLHLEEAILHLNPALLSLKDLELLGGAALLTKTGRGLVMGAGRAVLGGGAGAEAAEAGAGAVGAGALLPGLAIGAGISYEAVSHRDQIDNWMLQHFGFTGDVAHESPTIGQVIGIPGGQAIHDRLKAAADMVAQLTGQKPELVYGELAHETGNGTNRGYTSLHNLSGIEDGHGKYRSFDSDESWALSMARILNRDFAGVMAQTPEQYAAILKRGGYYEDSVANYARGIGQFAPQYAGGDTHITVNVAQSNATPADITRAVQDGIRQSNTNRDFSQTAQAAGVGQ